MPAGPKPLHVQGEVRVGTPTSKALLIWDGMSLATVPVKEVH
jgi:hypothetical protein